MEIPLMVFAYVSFFLHTSLATTYTPHDSLSQELQIRNCLALFELALDIDDATLLDEVFTADVVATFGPPYTPYVGLPAIEAAIAFPLKNLTTQMSSTSAVVNCTDQARPQSVSYFTASNFLKGQLLLS